MEEDNYFFDYTTLTLYNIWNGYTLEDIEKNYPVVYKNLTENQKNQYIFWVSLSEKKKQSIRDHIYGLKGSLIVNINWHAAYYIDYEVLKKMDEEKKLKSFKVINDEYVQYENIEGKFYLVHAQYDSTTN